MRSIKQDALKPSERVGELFAVQMLLLMLGFLVYHLVADTGFYTDEFGLFEKLCLFGPIVAAMYAPLTRLILGRRNPARPLEASADLLQALGSLWLLMVFPFDYSHLPDALPGFLRFTLSWVTDDIARIVFILMIAVGMISAIGIMWRYVTFPRLREETIHQPSSPR